ncbi:MAG: GNAT family N-acetyltransferase [Armatimonadetes bacterium]|nr:GNAT family N-acetyltransferase [Armatimonadota bacterium]
MDGLVCREATPEDVHDILKVRNAIFPPLTPQQWFADPSMTCSIAYLDGQPVGAIPLSVREFQVAPGVCVQAAFENAVGTREDMRGKGIGTAVIAAAREFLRGRCDDLMVYRGAERSDGYRFYVKSGHRDLLFLRPMVLAEPQRTEVDASVEGMDAVVSLQPQMLACFETTYGAFSGFPKRHATYWQQQLRSQIYEVLPQETFLIRHPAQGPLRAYVLVARRTRDDQRDHLTIMEAAGLSAEHTRYALLALGDFAAREAVSIRTLTSAEDPLQALLRELGYVEHLRTTMIMGQPLAPAELFTKVCTDLALLDELKIDFWAPFADGTLHEGPNAKREITLEGKDEVIYRLLNRRLDIEAAIRTEWLTIRNGTPEAVERLAAALPYAPWVYHHLDYI